MTDAKNAPKIDAPKAGAEKTPAKDADDATAAKTADDAGKAQAGDRDDVSGDQSVMERDDIGAADGPGKPETVKVITEVHPGTSN